MRKLWSLAGLTVVAWLGWQIGGMLSSDSLSMVLGVILGMMAGIPAALIAMSASRTVRHEHVLRIESPETPQKPVERISVLPASNAAGIGRIAKPDVIVLAGEGRKRLEVGR